jgi:hypothetical protein
MKAPATLRQAVAALQTLYDRADWTGIRARFSDPRLADSLLARMRRWKSEQVNQVRASLVYVTPLGRARFEGTVEFAADERTIPDYKFYVFNEAGRTVRIVGTAPGIGAATSDPSWVLSRTAHFIIYHSRYQLAGADRQYLVDLEHQRTQFAREFGVVMPPVATYHLYPDQITMDRMTGGSCGSAPGETGCTRPFTHPPSIYGVLRATYHEPIHVYELALAPRPSLNGTVWVAPLFIGEGTAVALEDKNADPRLSDYCSDLGFAPLDECARIAIAHLQPSSILSDTGFREADAGFAYSLGGSFVKYLILRYGYRPFGHFYYDLAAQPSDRVADYNVASQHVYHLTIGQLISAWTDELCRQGC